MFVTMSVYACCKYTESISFSLSYSTYQTTITSVMTPPSCSRSLFSATWIEVNISTGYINKPIPIENFSPSCATNHRAHVDTRT